MTAYYETIEGATGARVKCYVRAPGNVRTYLGTHADRATAEEVCRLFITTGEKPAKGKPGMKAGERQANPVKQWSAKRAASGQPRRGTPRPREPRKPRQAPKPRVMPAPRTTVEANRLAIMRRLWASMKDAA